MLPDPAKQVVPRSVLTTTFICSIILFGCSGTPAVERQAIATRLPQSPLSILSASPFPRLKQRIDALLPDSLFPPSSAGITIVSLASGETLYELNPDMMFNPASNQKLFTSAIALRVLGEDFLLKTDVLLDPFQHILIVKGHGDPLLSTGDLDSIARAVAPMLDKNEEWTVVADTSYFDQLYWGKGWVWDDEPDRTAMFISPLSVNGNTVKVSVRPGRNAGSSVEIAIDPPTSLVTMENSAVTATDSILEPITISRKWLEATNTVTVNGQMFPWDSPKQESISIRDPARYALSFFTGSLRTLGVPVDTFTLGSGESSRVKIYQFTHRLDSAIVFMNRKTDNLSAECLLKILGAEVNSTRGNAKAGIAILKNALASMEVDTSSSVFADGSGVSRYNLTTASTIVRLLQKMTEDPTHFPTFYQSLPVPGEYGTLSTRMNGTIAQGRVRAKTGTLAGVTALSGYATTMDGDRLAFSILMQNFQGGASPYRAVQDSIAVFLSSLREDSF